KRPEGAVSKNSLKSSFEDFLTAFYISEASRSLSHPLEGVVDKTERGRQGNLKRAADWSFQAWERGAGAP
ncbi:MAG: hypothetical protein K6E78_01025, partial [Treponema sp.]|nr:hypothetical protein [Treponema sp.]